MGMYNIIIATCPKCGGKIDDQFKQGICCMDTYNIDNPMSLENASIVHGVIVYCDHCETDFMVEADLPINKIKITLKPTE